MVQIKIKKGLDIPVFDFQYSEIKDLARPSSVALDLTPFSYLRLKPLKKEGETVLIGEPLAEDKEDEGKVFLSPGCGVIKEIIRGERRSLSYIVIETSGKDEFFSHQIADLGTKPSGLIKYLHDTGLFAHIVMRPFAVLPQLSLPPDRIFIKGIESAPLTAPAELQLEGFEEDFTNGISFLSRISEKIHLVLPKNSKCKVALQAKNVTHHTAEGPHPVANSSVHIHAIDPIKSSKDIVWTLDLTDVITIGMLSHKGIYHNKRIVCVTGPAILPEKRGLVRTVSGVSARSLVDGKVEEGSRIISGDPLMGTKVGIDGFLGFKDYSLCAFNDREPREMLHFLKLGGKKYSASRVYLSGFFKKGSYLFSTSQHGEPRPFIDGNVYDKVMPLRIPTMHLIKAVLADDYPAIEQLGILEVAPEDFALPTFICPSKIEMVDLIRTCQRKYFKEVLF